jgi:hypothetical protein
MAVQVELWRPDVIEYLEKDNEFMRLCVNADEFVTKGKIVHIPQSGGPAPVQRNRQQLPAPINKRNDTDIIYQLDDYTCDPILLPDADTKQLSYDKRRSIVSENFANLRDISSDYVLYLWSKDIPTANKILTSGANATATAPGATGNRKLFIRTDLRKAQKLLNSQRIPKADRYALIPDNLLDQLLEDLDDKLSHTWQNTIDLKNGVIGRLYGFNILTRSSVIYAAASGNAPKLPEAAAATDDNEAVLFWHKDFVERAYGSLQLFDDQGNPLYYGDLFSMLMYIGGRSRREDKKGVGLIVAAA